MTTIASLVWLVRRARLRGLWRRHRINFGEFLAGLQGAPPWLDRGTAPWWRYVPAHRRAERRAVRRAVLAEARHEEPE